MNDNDAPEMVCRLCGKATTVHEFYTLSSGRQWAHIECMLEAGRKVIADGELDDVKMAMMNWLEGAAEIRTGKQLREERR